MQYYWVEWYDKNAVYHMSIMTGRELATLRAQLRGYYYANVWKVTPADYM